jgi:hypothetical protein
MAALPEWTPYTHGVIRKLASLSPTMSALLGAALAMPFLLLNAAVANQVQPVLALLRPDTHTSLRELVVLAVVWLMIGGGALIAARPMLLGDADGRRRFYLLNGIMAALLLLVFVALSGLWVEVYRCEVLQIQNCD